MSIDVSGVSFIDSAIFLIDCRGFSVAVFGGGNRRWCI